jgi:hypothetical protein
MNNRSTHLSDEEIARYCGQRMLGGELLAADNHLAHCDTCYARMGEGEEGRNRLVAASRAFDEAVSCEVTHIGYEQMAGLVDGRLDEVDREIIESHIEMCPQCEAELDDLRDVSARMAAGTAKKGEPRGGPSFRERLGSLWRMTAFRIPAQAAAALAAVALLAFLISLPLRRENADLRARLADLERSNSALAEQAAAQENEVAALRQENDRLQQSAAEAGQVLVALNDGGGRVTLDRQGNLSGVQVESQYEQAIVEALRSERVRLPASLREIRTRAGTLMGGARDEFNVIAPVGVVIETDRPTFRWVALAGATSYEVTVYDANLTRVAASDAVTATEWAVPAALARGRVYIWQVRATKDGQQTVAPPPAAGRARFKVLEQSKVELVEQARRSHPKSHLVMGLAYAEAGLLNEAEREFTALLQANPDSPTARKLLQSVRAAK